MKNKSGLMTTDDKATLASREYVDGKVVNEATITTMINNGLSTATIKADQIQFSGHQVKFDAGEIVINSKNFNLDGYGNVTMSGEINATSGNVGGFKLENNNLVCENASLTIGGSSGGFTRKVVLDAKSYVYDNYNFALSVVNYGIVSHSSASQAGIHINVGASNANVQYPGIVMENGTFVGFRVPIIPLGYSIDLRNSASIYVSGMYVRCNNSTSITITLPTSTTGAKIGDVFTVIRAGTGDVTIKAPEGVSYRTSSGKTGEFTSTRNNEQIHLIFDGDTWFSECSAG